MFDYPETGNVWPGFKADKLPSNNPNSGIIRLQSGRTDGSYEITEEASYSIKNLTDTERARLTTWLVDQRAQGNTIPSITTTVVEDTRKSKSIPIQERADRLLRYFVSISDNIGKEIRIGCEGQRNEYGEFQKSSVSPSEEITMAWSESVSAEEVRFLIEYLVNQDWIGVDSYDQCNICTVTTVPRKSC